MENPLNIDIRKESVKSKIYKSLKSIKNVIDEISSIELYSTKLKNEPVEKVVCDKYKFLYVINPLVGSRTILNFFNQNKYFSDNISIARSGLAEIFCKSNRDRENYFVFSTCRSPWKRLVSCYNKKVLNANNIKKIAILAQYDRLRPQMKFESFAQWLCSPEGSDEQADPHWASQTQILFAEDGTARVDRIFRLKSLESQFASLCNELSVPFSGLPHRASSSDQLYPPRYSNPLFYYKSLDSTTIDCLDQRYARDASLLGYPDLGGLITQDS